MRARVPKGSGLPASLDDLPLDLIPVSRYPLGVGAIKGLQGVAQLPGEIGGFGPLGNADRGIGMAPGIGSVSCADIEFAQAAAKHLIEFVGFLVGPPVLVQKNSLVVSAGSMIVKFTAEPVGQEHGSFRHGFGALDPAAHPGLVHAQRVTIVLAPLERNQFTRAHAGGKRGAKVKSLSFILHPGHDRVPLIPAEWIRPADLVPAKL